MFDRIYNFSAGPAVLPEPVIQKVLDNLANYQGTGIGIMEMSHRTPPFEEILDSAERNLRALLDIPENYHVCFATGGATNQFSMAAMNLLSSDTVGNYLLTGAWAKKALVEAKKFGETHVVASSEDKNFNYIPKTLDLSNNSAYLHITSNNTIFGTQLHKEPEVGETPLVCDASSDLLHKKIDVSKYGIIYAGAQKNLGPAGVTLLIIRDDLLARSLDSLPVLMNYNTYVTGKSTYNTPPTFPIYVVKEVFEWLVAEGGLAAMGERNRTKASVLYDAIDGSDFFSGTAATEDRSLMNVTFVMADPDAQQQFLEDALAAGLSGLKGHRSVGGLRASIYNAFPATGVDTLVEFMKDFEKRRG